MVSFFDAYNCLGNFTYNHPDFVFPVLVNNSLVIKAKNLGHPLLKKSKRIDSDLNIDNIATGYVLTFSSGSLTDGVSNPFNR